MPSNAWIVDKSGKLLSILSGTELYYKAKFNVEGYRLATEADLASVYVVNPSGTTVSCPPDNIGVEKATAAEGGWRFATDAEIETYLAKQAASRAHAEEVRAERAKTAGLSRALRDVLNNAVEPPEGGAQ